MMLAVVVVVVMVDEEDEESPVAKTRLELNARKTWKKGKG